MSFLEQMSYLLTEAYIPFKLKLLTNKNDHDLLINGQKYCFINILFSSKVLKFIPINCQKYYVVNKKDDLIQFKSSEIYSYVNHDSFFLQDVE